MAGKKKVFVDAYTPDSLAAFMLRYLDWMGATNYSPSTVEARKADLHLFNEWCKTRSLNSPQDITKPVLEGFQRHLYHFRKPNGKPLGFHRQSIMLTGLKGFFKWLAQNDTIPFNPASELILPKVPKQLPKDILSIEEVETVLNQPDLTSPFGIRDRAIMETLYSTGIRRTELVNLTIYSIDQNRGTVFIDQGKGKKDRVVPIGERALAWISKYLDEVRESLLSDPNEGTLFITYQGNGFHPNKLTAIIRDYIKQADIGKSGSCHLFRHSMATLMLENGADVRFIQELLGHARLDTTQRYTHVSIGKLKDIHSATHPGAKLKAEHKHTH
ncbi:MAG: site-specific tyrosine recombinase XerC [Hahellaceae bacterium]|nr:site-specific tyrosine recombinase XerC [Hahellaceae bacterium]